MLAQFCAESFDSADCTWACMARMRILPAHSQSILLPPRPVLLILKLHGGCSGLKTDRFDFLSEGREHKSQERKHPWWRSRESDNETCEILLSVTAHTQAGRRLRGRCVAYLHRPPSSADVASHCQPPPAKPEPPRRSRSRSRRRSRRRRLEVGSCGRAGVGAGTDTQ